MHGTIDFSEHQLQLEDRHTKKCMSCTPWREDKQDGLIFVTDVGKVVLNAGD
jgi:hypothetical protein